MKTDKVLGCFEYVDFPEFGIKSAIAKIDTGAFSGALHCTNIEVVRRGKGYKPILKFNLLGDETYRLETTDFKRTHIRSATGHRIRRYVIDTDVVVGGVTYPIRIGLSDRSDMRRPVLLGRRFLREHQLLVDVAINQQLDDEKEKRSENRDTE